MDGAAMKVEVVRVGGGPVKFEDFADKHGLIMQVRERGGANASAAYYAHFGDVEVMERGCLIGEYGNGATPEEAIENYRRALRGKRLAYKAGSPWRVEIQCPTEWL